MSRNDFYTRFVNAGVSFFFFVAVCFLNVGLTFTIETERKIPPHFLNNINKTKNVKMIFNLKHFL